MNKNQKFVTLMCTFILMFTISGNCQKNGEVISKGEIAYPPYSEIKGMRFYYDSATYYAAVKDKTVNTKKIIYGSDSLKVVTYLSIPAVLQNKKYPVIIFNRGSLIRNDIAFVHRPLFVKLVKAGYIVVAPGFRQSEGGEGKFEIGGKDVDDILNLLPVLSSLSYVDTSKIFMLGESMGGVMTYLALKNQFPVKAAATIGAITDMELFGKETEGIEAAFKQFIPDFEINRDQLLKDRSVVNWVEKINVPVLIMQGQADLSVNPHHALYLAQKLLQNGKVFQLVILEGGNHVLSKNNITERDKQVINWFNKYLTRE